MLAADVLGYDRDVLYDSCCRHPYRRSRVFLPSASYSHRMHERTGAVAVCPSFNTYSEYIYNKRLEVRAVRWRSVSELTCAFDFLAVVFLFLVRYESY